MEIRLASLQDLPALVRLNQEVQALHVAQEPWQYRPTRDEDLAASIRERLGASLEYWLALEPGPQGEEALGYAATQVLRRPANAFTYAREILLVDQLGVSPSARRRGVGRALMEHLQRRAQAPELSGVELDVRGFNAEAQAFYEALGYRPSSIRMRLGL